MARRVFYFNYYGSFFLGKLFESQLIIEDYKFERTNLNNQLKKLGKI